MSFEHRGAVAKVRRTPSEMSEELSAHESNCTGGVDGTAARKIARNHRGTGAPLLREDSSS